VGRKSKVDKATLKQALVNTALNECCNSFVTYTTDGDQAAHFARLARIGECLNVALRQIDTANITGLI
jgi:hypothetical protein